jgi:hypothetical protein
MIVMWIVSWDSIIKLLFKFLMEAGKQNYALSCACESLDGQQHQSMPSGF